MSGCPCDRGADTLARLRFNYVAPQSIRPQIGTFAASYDHNRAIYPFARAVRDILRTPWVGRSRSQRG